MAFDLGNLFAGGHQILGDGILNFVRDPVGTTVNGVKMSVTVPITAVTGFLGHESSIIYTATSIFKEADDDSRRGLIDEALRRSPGLINPGTLLEAGKTLICGTISEEMKMRPVVPLINDIIECSLELVGSAVDLVQHDLLLKTVLLKTVKSITEAILNAVTTTVGELPFIKDAVFSNDINAATLGLIWSNGFDLAKFLVDLAECTKCYVTNTSRDGTAVPDEKRGEYNELDFSKTMNRHAAICQLQRLALSIIFILKGMTKSVDLERMEEYERIEMTEETKLVSDVESGTIIEVPLEEVPAERPGERAGGGTGKQTAPLTDGLPNGGGKNQTGETPGDKQPRKTQKVTNEEWLFVNGIAGEYHWTRLACEKLVKTYFRDMRGIFNKGDGILWDLVECSGERSAQGRGKGRSQKQLIWRTDSSRKAQQALKTELENGLGVKDNYIVMIAHSQGCLLLRLALEELVKNATGNLKKTMQERLCVFTFGNPSVDWKLDDSVEAARLDQTQDCEFCNKVDEEKGTKEDKNMKRCRHLSTYVLRTEHFANSKDFVANLGVLSNLKPIDSGYNCVFKNEEKGWTGHLFGSQYSLNAKDYWTEGHQKSWLLACERGKSMEDVKNEILRKPTTPIQPAGPSVAVN